MALRATAVSGRLFSSEGLKRGDVLIVATKRYDSRAKRDYWWRRFMVVTEVPAVNHYVEAARIELDMSEPRKFEVDLELEVVEKVPVERWPEGVAAMVTKARMKGWIEVD